MKLIKTDDFKADIDAIDMILYGRTDQETFQSKPLMHQGEMYIAYAPMIDEFADGKEIVDLVPDGLHQAGDAPVASVIGASEPDDTKSCNCNCKVEFSPEIIIEKAKPVSVKVEPANVTIEKADPVEVKVTVEKPDPVEVNVELKQEPAVNEIKLGDTNVSLEVQSLVEELKMLREQLSKPWWKRFLGK